MNNLEWLKSIKQITVEDLSEYKMPIAKFAIDLRIMKSLEIIAEEFCKLNNRAEIYQEELNRFEEINKEVKINE